MRRYEKRKAASSAARVIATATHRLFGIGAFMDGLNGHVTMHRMRLRIGIEEIRWLLRRLSRTRRGFLRLARHDRAPSARPMPGSSATVSVESVPMCLG